jgi:multiple sugar transport system ATP-binding protein
MVTFRIGGTFATVKADKDFRAKIGDVVRASIPASTVHLFDATSGERL